MSKQYIGDSVYVDFDGYGLMSLPVVGPIVFLSLLVDLVESA